MTDRIHALTITLDRDIRDDDIAGLVTALKHMRFVADVQPHVTDLEDHTARMRVASTAGVALHRAVHAILFDGKDIPEDWNQ